MALGGRDWADFDDDDEEEIQVGPRAGAFETAPDGQGIKVVVEYTEREGKTYKICKRLKQTKTHKWSNAAINARKEMEKFGKAATCDPSTAKNLIIRSEEEIHIEFTKKNVVLTSNNDAEDKFFDESITVCEDMTKEKKSWADAQKEKNTEAEGPVGGAAEVSTTAAPAPGPGGANVPGKYVPPSLRQAGAGGKGDGKGKGGTDQEASLRITNLSEDAKEGDLQDLFGKIGRLQRVFLSKDQSTGLSKGFAFITYYTRDDAQKAIDVLNGHGYDNLILQVQWAKPRA